MAVYCSWIFYRVNPLLGGIVGYEINSIIVDFIGRFESLEKDVAKLSEMLGMEINLPHLNINEKDYYIYTDEMKIKVNEVYKQDFDLLAY